MPLWRDPRDPGDPGDPRMSSARLDLMRRLRTSEPNARNWVAKSDTYTQIFQNLIKNYPKCQSLTKKVVFDFEKPPEGACHSHGGSFPQKIGSQRVPQGPIGSVVLIPEENIVLISEEGNGLCLSQRN